MRYDDASQAGSTASDSTPVARPDIDALAPGSFGPASGNAITGAGTTTGASGEDSVGNAPAHIVAVQGAGGGASSADGNFQATGQFGVLGMDAQGNFNYVRNAGTPDGVQDVFNYTLADADGQTSSTTLTIDIAKGGTGQAQVIPGTAPVIPGVVNLPAGVQMSDIHVNGRDLIINMPDGSQMVIPNGAVFVPQLVIGDVQLPASNLAALLVESEPQPAAGNNPSSGGNFATDVPPLDPGIPLGDLIPPTELVFTLPDFEEVGDLIDQEPEAGTASVLLDDDDVPGKNGNAGGTGDDAGSPNATASGSLPGSGGDGALTWDLLTTGAPSGFSYVDGANGSVLVQQVQNGSTVTVLTITINSATGAFTVTENAPILHAAGGDENNVSFVVNYNVTDSDGDAAAGTLNINVDDDTPTVTVNAGSDANVILTTDDAQTIGVASDTAVTTANFSGVFSGSSSSSGADGAGPGTSDTYALAVTALGSGLTSHGAAINLFLVSGVVVGSTAASAGAITTGNTIFTVATTNTGIVTLTQLQQIDHPVGQDPTPTGTPFADQIISMTDGLVTLTRSVTVVDKDGDSVTGSATVNIGANLHFTDDGPTIGLADRGEPTLVVDETNLAGNATQSFAANFAANFGADGPAAAGNGLTYALSVSGSGADSGLIDSASGNHVFLFVENGQVVGREGANSGAAAAGPIVFAVSVNASGEVTVDQQRAVIHGTPSSPDTDEPVTLSADTLVRLTATATDFDGDTASQTINIGTNLVFRDDGPDASTNGNGVGTVTLDETRPEGTDTPGAVAPSGDASEQINLAAGFVTGGSVAFGADGPGSVSYALVLSANGIGSGLFALDPTDTTAGDGDGIGRGAEITLSQTGNVVTGSAGGVDYFTITIDPATGVATFAQLHAIWHPTPGSSYDEGATLSTAAAANLQVVQTVVDADGDFDTAAVNLGQGVFSIQDDGPDAQTNGTAVGTVVLDETRPEDTDTPGGVAPSGDASATINFAANFVTGGAVDFGSDGAGTVAYSLLLSANGIASGLFALDAADTSAGDGDGIGQGAAITLSQSGNTITGSVGATQYFTISIDAATGIATFTQINPIWHPAPGSSFDENAALSTTLASNIQVVQTVTDADGDTDSASINVGQGVFIIQDDGPDAQTNGQGFGTVTLDETRPENTDTAGGVAPSGDASNLINLAAGFVTGGAVDFGSDGAGSVQYSLLLSANGIASGLFALQPGDTSAGDGDGIGQGASITLSQSGNTVTGSVGATQYFTITIDPNTGVATFTQINPIWHPTAGSSFDEGAPLSTTLASNLQVVQTVTDRDGDVDTASINIGQGVFIIQDDGPDAQTNGNGVGTVTLDESRPENTDTAGGVAPSGDSSNVINLAAGFVTGGAVDFGADGAGSVSYSLLLSANGIGSGMFAIDPTDTSAGDGDGIGRGAEITLSQSGNTITGSVGATQYFTITIDPATGVATFTQLDNIWQPTPGSSFDEAAILNTAAAANLQVVQTVTDVDGDVDTASINIGQGVFQIQDDGPIASPDTDTVSGNGGTATGNVITDAAAGDAGDSDNGADDVGEDTPGRVSFIDNANDGAAGVAVPTGGAGVDIAGQFGTLHIAASGDYTYTRSGGLGGGQSETFNYTLIDADGDTVTSTLTIQIADVVPVAGTANAAVDDDGLGGANTAAGVGDIDANTFPNPDDLDGPGSSEATFTGLLTGTPGDGTNTFLFLGSVAGTTATVGQETVTYSVSGAVTGGFTTLTATVTGGSRGGTVLFTVNITNQTTGQYTVTLLDNVIHPTLNGLAGDDQENNSTVVVPFQMRDADGDNSAAAGQLTITFNDDVPVAVNDSDTVVAGTLGPATGNVLTGVDHAGPDANSTDGSADSFGADGAGTIIALTSNNVPANPDTDGSLNFAVAGQYGSLALNANGDYTYTRAAGTQGGVNDVFTYTIQDADGDKTTATITIHIDDAAPVAADGVAAVDDDGLSGGNAASVTGDLDANAGEAAPANSSEAIFHGQLVGTGGDTITNYSFAGMDNTNGTVGTDTVHYTWNNAISTLTATITTVGGRVGTVLFTVVVNQATGSYNLNLLDNVLHAAGSNENDATTNLTFTVTDTDGDHDDGTIVVTFDDDAPTLGTVQNQQTDNNPATTPAVGTLHFTAGADGAGSAMTITADNTGITSGGHALVTNQVGNVLTAYQDIGPAGYDAGDTTVVYTLTVNPSAGTSGQYVFDLVTAFDPTVTETDIGGSASFGAGPTLGQVLTDGVAPTPNPLSAVSGYHPTGSFSVATWQAGNLATADVVSAGVNGSTAGWGVDNNNFETGNSGQELMFFDFGNQALADPDGDPAPPGPDAADYTPPPVSLPDITFAKFDFIGYKSGAGNAGDDIAYVVHFTDGTSVTGFIPAVNIDGATWEFDAPGGKFIADISFYSGVEPDGTAQSLPPGKIDLVSVGVTTTSIDETPSFTVQLTDGDGDTTTTGAFTVHVSSGLSPNPPAAQALILTKPSVSTMDPIPTTTNSNAILMGAFAAAGLAASEPLAAQGYHSVHSLDHHAFDAFALHTTSLTPVAVREFGGGEPAFNLSAIANGAHVAAPALNQGFHAADNSQAGAALDSAGSHSDAAAVPSLSQGTDAPASHAADAPAALTASAVAMPDAALLAAAGYGGLAGQAGSIDGQHDQVVAQVLADALHGGQAGPNIEALVNAASGGDHVSGSVMDVLASHAATSVPNGDMGIFSGFTGIPGMPMMEQMVMHADAAPAHA